MKLRELNENKMDKNYLKTILWICLVLALLIVGKGIIKSKEFKSSIGIEKTRNAVNKP